MMLQLSRAGRDGKRRTKEQKVEVEMQKIKKIMKYERRRKRGAREVNLEQISIVTEQEG